MEYCDIPRSEYVTRNLPRVTEAARDFSARGQGRPLALVPSVMRAAQQRLFLYDMPGEILVLCVNGSMRIAFQLAQTNIVLGARLRHAARNGEQTVTCLVGRVAFLVLRSAPE